MILGSCQLHKAPGKSWMSSGQAAAFVLLGYREFSTSMICDRSKPG